MLKGLVFLALALCAACSDNDPQPIINVASPAAPSTPAPPACVTNSTADVSFQNLGEQWIDVILDGLYIGTLPPESPPGFEQNVAANIAHRLDWRLTNTATPSMPSGLLPCLETRPIAVQCAKVIWTSCYGF